MHLRTSLVAAAVGSAAFAYNNGLPPFAPRGWSTWCTDDACGLLDYCSEGEIRSIADALVSSGMAAAGYDMILLDDCWADTTRDANGNLQPDPSRFPSGIPALVSYVKAQGLRLGLYTDVGNTTCKYGRTGSGGHFKQDAQWFADNGVSYVKMDWCDHGSAPAAQQYGNFSAALNATGTPMWFGTCDWGEQNPWEWGPSIAQQFRVAEDHLPFWTLTGGSGNGFGQGVYDYINWMANLTAQGYKNAPWAYLDTDFLMTGFPTLSNTESETEFAFWTLWGSPLIVTTDVRNMSDWKRGVLLNMDILAVANDSLGATGVQVSADQTAKTQIWKRPLANGDIAVILFNANDWVTQPVGVTWTQLGWNANANVTIYDLWARAPVGASVTGYSAILQPHSTAYLRLTPPTSERTA